ncbi:hypothetical protein BTN50_0119 [Candidatus Enterovibrio altilux]|uniref:Uncharacterized protein n=1 Tax=Candidatus Enterovibrio altilux TaxID=1927128 RepID=A0A291B6P6_9GAMM|nr:hypothetical protein BTN50_0119 [Candidatus Enterovibrio luxaltus]
MFDIEKLGVFPYSEKIWQKPSTLTKIASPLFLCTYLCNQ